MIAPALGGKAALPDGPALPSGVIQLRNTGSAGTKRPPLADVSYHSAVPHSIDEHAVRHCHSPVRTAFWSLFGLS